MYQIPANNKNDVFDEDYLAEVISAKINDILEYRGVWDCGKSFVGDVKERIMPIFKDAYLAGAETMKAVKAVKVEEVKHRMYCRKSGMSCLVYHTDGVCSDVRDCEGCAAENSADAALSSLSQKQEEKLEAIRKELIQ